MDSTKIATTAAVSEEQMKVKKGKRKAQLISVIGEQSTSAPEDASNSPATIVALGDAFGTQVLNLQKMELSASGVRNRSATEIHCLFDEENVESSHVSLDIALISPRHF
jgi:hypothetical protein